MSAAVQNNGNSNITPTTVTNNNNYVDNQKYNRKRGTNTGVQKIECPEVLMMGSAGYAKSWSVIQRAVDHLMTERTIPLPVSTLQWREPRHLPKRRIFVSLYRDVHLNNLILKTQQFQKEFEKEGLPFARKVIIDYPTERQRPRRERHYEFWPYFEQLPDLEEEEQVAPEDVKEQEVRDALGFASDNTIEVAEECKENSTFLPAPLSEELTKEIGELFQTKLPEPKLGFVEKYMKKGPFARIF